MPTATAVFAREKKVEIKKESVIALRLNKKKYVKTTVLLLYKKRLLIVHAVMIPEEIPNCTKNKIREKVRTPTNYFLQ